MVNFICSCCGGTKGRIAYSKLTSVYSSNEWSVSICENCSNGITIPVPEEKLLGDIYSNTYLYPVHHLILGEKRMRAKDLARYIRTHYSGENKKVFEAGCMFGYLLNELKSDFAVKGIEIGEEAVDVCRAAGLDVHDSSVEHYLLNNDEKFDIIVLSHVFEHLLSCDMILEELAQRLNPDGRIIFCIPNTNSFSKKLFGRYWGWWQVPVHINHFNEKALSALATRKNLRIETTRHKGGDSLMLLLNFINIFKFHKQSTPPGVFQKFIIKAFSGVGRYWYYLGNEELTVVIRK